MAIHELLNPIFNPLLSLHPFFIVLIISFIVALITTLIYKFTTNQILLKEIKSETKKLQDKLSQYQKMQKLWGEFDNDLVTVKDVRLNVKKLAGVKTPVYDGVDFEIKPYSLFNAPVWFTDGVNIIKQIAETAIESEVFNQKMYLLDFARKKTTQKVNLYEKVQIPGFQDAIRKIKRFLEDEENLSKSAQKIVKDRQQKVEAELW